MRFWRRCVCAGLMFFAFADVEAHHSFAALFDTKRTLTLTGEVVEFEFEAPHSYIHLNITDEAGVQSEWQIETTTPGMLLRTGITPATLKPGDTVTVSGNPTRDGRPIMRLLTITMPDGAEIQVQE